jgi:hypothetical protein
MFRNEDINIVNDNIDNIINEALSIYRNNYEPTFIENKKVYEEILNYIKDNKKIIYGGYAQNELIKIKNVQDGFYKENDIPDVEFYSPEPLKDGVKLCNKLYEKGFKYIVMEEGIHKGTFKIFVNFINYCDISYLSKNIYDKCNFIEDKKGLRYIHPYFIYIDFFRVFCDPMTSYYRLDKSFHRYNRLIKYFPMESKFKNIKIEKNFDNDIIKKVFTIFVKSKYIIVGYFAYNYYVKKISDNTIDVGYFEIITENLIEECKIIHKKLQNLFNEKITTKQYYPFHEFFDNQIGFYLNDKLLLKVYGNNNKCIIYNFIEEKKIYIGRYSLVYLYMLINYNYAIINNKNANNYLNMCINLNYCKNKYLEMHDKTVLDSTPFQEFTYECIGNTSEVLYTVRKKNYDDKKEKKYKKFRFEPSEKEFKIPELKFPNGSGNEISEKYLILKI